MEFKELIVEARGLPPGALSRSGVCFLLEEGRLRHETRHVILPATDPAPSVRSSMARASAFSRPGFTRAVTK